VRPCAPCIPARPLTLNTTAGFETPGQTSSVKVYVILTAGNGPRSPARTVCHPAHGLFQH
jgi:hypothetical protein